MTDKPTQQGAKTEFTRERRYIVIKLSDVKIALSVAEQRELESLCKFVLSGRQMRGKPDLQCVVVESDWPEYEPTWKAIEARMNGVPDSCAALRSRASLADELANALERCKQSIEYLGGNGNTAWVRAGSALARYRAAQTDGRGTTP